MQEKPKVRCAIYTRKSNEEGLEQEFNSLDAQRLAGESYINSQKHEGWVLIPSFYNDGGYSGGNMERPALKKLIADIKEGYVDCVVVYKIDRLTRSLYDFSKIIELFEAHKVSFISVTQSFNTANSMGRLMLHVLLSFAQYERELTSERVRDKFIASKKKGMWMGGRVPLGYDNKDGKLIINEEEAKIIRFMFENFYETKSVVTVVENLKKNNFTSKKWVSASGQIYKGRIFSKREVYRILNSNLYIGKVKHGENTYDGIHKPIINLDLWDKVHKTFKTVDRISKPLNRVNAAPILKGLLKCHHCGSNMIAIYSSNQNGRRYSYYSCYHKLNCIDKKCIIGSIPSNEIETIVIARVQEILKSPEIIASLIVKSVPELTDATVINHMKNIGNIWDELFPAEQMRIIRLLINKIIVSTQGVDISIYSDGLYSLIREVRSC